jgi:hypothetical protein
MGYARYARRLPLNLSALTNQAYLGWRHSFKLAGVSLLLIVLISYGRQRDPAAEVYWNSDALQVI